VRAPLPAWCLAALLVVPVAAVAAPKPPPADPDAVRTTLQETTLLERRVQLAEGKEFYLLLDPRANTLKLMLRAATLREFPVREMVVGTPAVLFRASALPGGWMGRIWNAGALDPPRDRERVELIPEPVEEQEKDPVIPPTPEEIYEVPHRYLVRYGEGLTLEFHAEGEDEGTTAWQRFQGGMGAWWDDLTIALDPQPSDAIRLKLTLSREDFDTFYRSLPPDTKLMILPMVSGIR